MASLKLVMVVKLLASLEGFLWIMKRFTSV